MQVFDEDDVKADKHDFIGEAVFELGEAIGARGRCMEVPLSSEAKGGWVLIYADEVKQQAWEDGGEDGGEEGDLNAKTHEELRELVNHLPAQVLSHLEHVLQVTASATNLDKKDFFGKSVSYYRIVRSRVDGVAEADDIAKDGQVVYRSTTIKKNLNPTWPTTSISLRKLCNGDRERPLLVEVHDWDRNSADDLIGSFITTGGEVLKGGNEYPLVHPKKMHKKNSGKKK
jgi:hypothetical protein